MATAAKRIAPLAIFLAVALVSPSAFASLTVQGTVRFENRGYTQNGWTSTAYAPARFITVDVLRATDNAVLQTTSTSATGFYSTTVSSLNAGSSYKVRARAETAAVIVGDDPNEFWNCTTVSLTSTNVALDLSLAGTCGVVARALNIVDAVVEGYQWAEARAGGPPEQIDVVYPSGPWPVYDSGANIISIPDDDAATNDDVIIHEYGHFLWDDFTLLLALPGGEHGVCSAASSNNLAFSEAWATFISLAVRSKEWGIAYYPSVTIESYLDFETGTGRSVNTSNVTCPAEPGADRELAIGAVLSDTRDSADESFDSIDSMQQKTWDILDKNWQNRSSAPTVDDFRTEWANNGQMNPLFCKYINPGAAYCSISAPVANAASSITSSSFQANWSPASGASGYRLDVSTSSSFGSFVFGFNNLDVGNAVSRSVTGLTAGINYYYRLRAYDGSSTSGNSNTITVTTSSGGQPAPAVTGVSPSSGPATGGTSVTVNGSNFIAGATVTFGGSAATNVSFINSSALSCTTPAHAAGSVTVAVTNPDNQSGQLGNAFTYQSGGTNLASYDGSLLAPKCASVSNNCDSGSLLDGRSGLGPEPHAPNTLGSSCADGNAGSYHDDESIDRLQVATVDGSPLAPGKQVRIDATVWAFSDYSFDHLDLFYAANASNPVWLYVTTLDPFAQGPQLLSATYTLPAGGGVQAVRGIFRFEGTPSTCGSNSGFDDYDDLAFAVSNTVTRTLTVASSNPGSGVGISVSPADSNGASDGTTQFTRAYASGVTVSLVAPTSVPGGTFQKWQRDGADWSSSSSTTVTMSADHTMTAVYTAVQLLAPSNFIATYDANTDVIVTSWAGVAGAYDYEVELFYNGAAQGIYSVRGAVGSAATGMGFGFGGSHLCVRFRVRTLDAALNRSPWSGPDVATSLSYSDDPVAAAATLVRAAQINELRTAVSLARTAAGLSPYAFSRTLTAGVSAVRAADVTELRTALLEAFGALGIPTPAWVDPSLTLGTLIKGAHVQQLREVMR